MLNSKNTYRNLIVPAILVVALLTLAALQIVWLRDLSNGQRERMKENVEIGAARLAEELTEILQSTHNEFQFIDKTGDSLSVLIESVDRIWTEWRSTADYPGLIESILVIHKSPQDSQFVSISASGSVHRKPPSEHIIEILGRTPNNPAAAMIPNLATVFGDESMLLVNAIDPVSLAHDGSLRVSQTIKSTELASIATNAIVRINSAAGRTAVVQTKSVPATQLILVIDRNYMKDQVIPVLTAKHLMYDGSLDYNISIAQVDSADTFVYYGGFGDAGTIENADAVIPITHPKETNFFIMNTGANVVIRNRSSQFALPAVPDSVRRSYSYSFTTSRSSDSLVPAPAITFNQASFQSNFAPTWNLYVRHNLGSIDAAANQFRRNSSVLSLGILSILGLGFMLIFRNTAKANELARQQMEFVAGVSHELRTPLSVIRSAGDNMTAGLIKDENGARRYGKLIHSESMRLNDLIEQVLEFSGIQSGQRRYDYKPAEPHILVLHSLKGLGERVDPEKVSVNVSFEPCPNIMADTSGLISVIQNLVINAVKYSNNEPLVNIRVYNKANGGKHSVCIDVTDNGQGIQKDELDKIFEPFYRARGIRDQQIKGNGLGLSIVKSIMQQHDGNIAVTSSYGVGSTFTLSFNWLQ